MRNNTLRFSRYLRRLRSLGSLGDFPLPDFIDDYAVRVSSFGDGLEESVEGLVCDFNGVAGTSCFAIQIVGALIGATLTGKIQHSDDNSSWSDVAGAIFSAVSVSNNYQAIEFSSGKRYLRFYWDIGGGVPLIFTTALILKSN